MARRSTSEAGLALIAAFEGYRETSMRLPDGRWTVGYGSSHVADSEVSVTHAEAKSLLQRDLIPIEDFLNDQSFAPLGQHQFDALASFAFNIGLEEFQGSAVLHHVSRGEPIAAALAMDAWRVATVNGQTAAIDALVRRRAAEKMMFLSIDADMPTAATPLLKPHTDAAFARAVQDEPVLEWFEDVETASADTDTFELPDVVVEPGQSLFGTEPLSEPLLDVKSPQEQAAAALERRMERLVGPLVAADPQPLNDNSEIEKTLLKADDALPMVDDIPPVETHAQFENTTALDDQAVVTQLTVEPSESIEPLPFPANFITTQDGNAPAMVRSLHETVGPVSSSAETVEIIAAAPVALPVGAEGAKSEAENVPLNAGPVVPTQSRLVQGLIVLFGLVLLLWSLSQAGAPPAKGSPEPNVAVLLAVAGACFVAVGGYFLIRPPKPD